MRSANCKPATSRAWAYQQEDDHQDVLYNAQPTEEGVWIAGVCEGYCGDTISCVPKLSPVIQDNIRSIHKGASMINASHVRLIRRLTFGVLVLAATSWGQSRPPIAEEMAKTYGLDSWGQIEGLRYTFNLDIPSLNLKLSQKWEWDPKTGQVTYEGKDKEGKPVKVTYLRSQLSSQPANVKDEVEPAFVNDEYWLIFPFHVVWDSSADVQDKGKQKLPLGKGSAKQVVVKYPAEAGGYTPGDTWELFVGPDNRVEEFIYRRGGPKKPGVVIATWAGYKKAGPLLFSTEHRGTADGKPLHLFFSDVAVKLTGSDTWISAQ
jgi:hypothetical protein